MGNIISKKSKEIIFISLPVFDYCLDYLKRLVTIITKETMIKTETAIIAIVIFLICVFICSLLSVIFADRLFI